MKNKHILLGKINNHFSAHVIDQYNTLLFFLSPNIKKYLFLNFAPIQWFVIFL